MRFLLRIILVIATTHLCRYSLSTATNSDNALRTRIITDITDSICHLSGLEKDLLYLEFCNSDGFNECDEIFHVQDDYEYISLDCDNKCSNVNVVWNIHLLSQNYNITVQCQNDSCTGISNYTKLLNIEQDFIMENSSLGYLNDHLFDDALVGCIATADNCTENHFWIVNDLETHGGFDVRISSPVNETTYYAALGESLTVTCEIHGDHKASVTWNKSNTNVIQSVQYYHCPDFDISNETCILPSLRRYKEKRVRSRLFTLFTCQSRAVKSSTLDIPIVNWTDNGLLYKCISKEGDFGRIIDTVHINVIVDAIPKFTHLPPSYSEQNTTTATYSCVVQGGLSAKVQWRNGRGDVMPERSENDTNLPPIYVTYSMYNVSTVFSANNFSYIGETINSVYPVHNVTLHYNGVSQVNKKSIFICGITGMKEEFLKQYSVTDEDLSYLMTVYQSSASTSKFEIRIIIDVSLILAFFSLI